MESKLSRTLIALVQILSASALITLSVIVSTAAGEHVECAKSALPWLCG